MASLQLLQQARSQATSSHQAAQIKLLGEKISDYVVHMTQLQGFEDPSANARVLLEHVAAAAQGTQHNATVSQQSVVSHGNAMLGPVLHTGDEVWAVAASLIAQAQTSLMLEVWAYHPRSKAARHIMGAIAHLQLRQAQKRDRGESVMPITLCIALGSGSWDKGSARKSGGADDHLLDVALQQDAAGLTQFHYGIFPIPIDPSLIALT